MMQPSTKFDDALCDFEQLGKSVWEAMRDIAADKLDTLTLDPKIKGVGKFVISRGKKVAASQKD